MDPRVAQVAVVVLGSIALVSAMLWISHWYTERALTRWAEGRGYHLAAWRFFTPMWSGPRAWRRFRWQADYRVAVYEPRLDRAREGWLMVDWPFSGIGTPKVVAQWDGCMPEYHED